MSPLATGTVAPDFTLRDQNNQEVSLGALRVESPVMVVFFPLAFTGTCEGELGWLRDHQNDFDDAGLAVIAVSVGAPPTHKVWASAQGFLMPILSDFWPHGAVADKYGVLDETRGIANRGTFVVDTDGKVVFSAMVGPGEMRTSDTWRDALAAVAN